MDDRALIADAYGKIVGQVFMVFFGAYTEAQGDPDGEAAAEQRFRKSIAHARHVRDRALAALP